MIFRIAGAGFVLVTFVALVSGAVLECGIFWIVALLWFILAELSDMNEAGAP